MLTSSGGEQESNSCKHVRQAASRKHLDCVKHFWGLRTKGNPEEEYFEKQAMLMALMNKNLGILEYLVSQRCPWDPKLADGFLCKLQTSPWSEWVDLYDLAFKHKLLSPNTSADLPKKFMNEGRWDFLEKLGKYGQTFEQVRTRALAFGPDGANVAALRELHNRKAFRSADLSWLTPGYAVKVDDLALLKFACELRPEEVAKAKAKIDNPAMLEWLDNQYKYGRAYLKARLL